MPSTIRRALCIVLAAALPAFAQDAPAPEATSALAERQVVRAESFMIATANPLATRAGYDILAAGGSAADAAVAAQMVLNVVEPQSSGIGGGGFALYWNAALGELASYDGRETAPEAATPNYWLDAEGAPMEFWDAVPGGRSVGRARHPEADGDAAPALRPAPLGYAFPARDRARRERLSHLAADGRRDRRRAGARPRPLPRHARALPPPGRQPQDGGGDLQQPRARQHLPADRRRGQRAVLRRRHRPRHGRRRQDRDQPGHPHPGRSRRLRGQGATAGLPALPRLSRSAAWGRRRRGR